MKNCKCKVQLNAQLKKKKIMNILLTSLLNIVTFLLNAGNHEESLEVFDCSTTSGHEEVLECIVG